MSQEGDIALLDVSEDVSAENVSVLRAGVSKLLKSGKNKIILNLLDAKQLPMDVIREIVKLHLVATELKGQVLIVGKGDLVKQAVQSFAAPPPIKYFPTKEAALGAFREGQETKAPAPIDPNDPLGSLKAQLKKLEDENKSLKAKLQGRNVDEIQRLRFENGIFQQQVIAMEEQLKLLIKDRKKPFELESLQTKITQLETALTEFAQKEGLVGKAK